MEETARICKACGVEYAIERFPLVRMHYDPITKEHRYQYRRKICEECYRDQVKTSVSYRTQKKRKLMNKNERLQFLKQRYRIRQQMQQPQQPKKEVNFAIMQHIS